MAPLPPAPDAAPEPATRAEPAPGTAERGPASEKAWPDPTRYGDWERKGRCIDF
jgi:hypothetical protein